MTLSTPVCDSKVTVTGAGKNMSRSIAWFAVVLAVGEMGRTKEITHLKRSKKCRPL